MGFLDDLSDALDGLATIGEIFELSDKYDFSDFDDAISCIKESIKAYKSDDIVKSGMYFGVLTSELSDLNSKGEITDMFIQELYGYCRGVKYDSGMESLQELMDDIGIFYDS